MTVIFKHHRKQYINGNYYVSYGIRKQYGHQVLDICDVNSSIFQDEDAAIDWLFQQLAKLKGMKVCDLSPLVRYELICGNQLQI